MPAIDAQWAAVAAGVAGLLIGSFLNVVIYRLPRMLERQWQLDAADLRGETIATTARSFSMKSRMVKATATTKSNAAALDNPLLRPMKSMSFRTVPAPSACVAKPFW